VVEHAISAGFALLGGFNASIDAPTTGRPWLSGVVPLHGPLLGGTTHTVHGTELHLGAATNVTVGGAAAAVSSRARDHVTLTLPRQVAPGWKLVTATNEGGTAALVRGIGVLPLLDKAHAVAVGEPFRITYRGTQGDILYLAAAGARFPAPVPVPPYHHGLELHLGALLALVGPIPVSDPSGVFHLDLPGFVFARPLYVQMLGVPVGNPGYGPGCFTNVIEL